LSPERWQRAKQILQGALDVNPARRSAFLDEACAGDGEMRNEVESLLQSNEDAGSFLESPALAESAITELDMGLELAVGSRLGAYRIVQEIGEGGMGVVYQAIRDDDQFRKLVAIKILKQGLDSRYILRRFHNERQILAHFDHPNIAKLLDGGTTEDGRPYFVMEFIAGKAVNDYCDERRLSIDERLRLFLKVCSAVQYAHQNLVVHRDLKPSNILVAEDGEPKLLDFGIAKVLDDEREITATLRAMTPEYASPEQVLGQPISTASDIYSLGVLLYELLAGRRPYTLRNRTPLEAAEVIVKSEPTRPSLAIAQEPVKGGGTAGAETRTIDVSARRSETPERLRKRLAGDLDNIILMTLRKEPQRRYQSVEQLAGDIRRYFDGRPVAARTDTLWYRTAKFVRRNKAGMISVVLVFVSLIAGIVTTAWQASMARAQRARAEEHFQEVRTLANSLIFEVHDAIQNLPGSTPARELIVKRALEYLDRLSRSAANDQTVARELAVAYRKISEVEGSPYAASLGHTEAAIEGGRKALAILDKLAAEQTPDVALRQEIGAAHANLGDLLWLQGKWDGALNEYQQGLNTYKELTAIAPDNRDFGRELSVSYISVGDTLKETGKVTAALDSYRKGLEIRKGLLAVAPKERRPRRDVAVGYIKVAGVLLSVGETSVALENFRAALPLFERLAAEDATNAQAASDLTFVERDGLGDALARNGDAAGALALYRKALARAAKISSADPTSSYASRSLLISHAKVGQALLALRQPGQSADAWGHALDVAKALSGGDPNNAQARGDLAFCAEGLGDAQLASGNVPSASENYQRSLEAWTAVAAVDPKSTQARDGSAQAHLKVGDAQMASGRAREALASYTVAATARQQLAQEDPINAEVRANLAISSERVGQAHAALARRAPSESSRTAEWREARAWFQRAVSAWQEIQKRSKLDAHNAEALGKAQRELAASEAALAPAAP
jgi:eukaryotic-like serine/threonine-protein kinase